MDGAGIACGAMFYERAYRDRVLKALKRYLRFCARPVATAVQGELGKEGDFR
jgi:hypothetical protein